MSLQYEEEEAYKREQANKPADFLAPYLVSFKGQLNEEESMKAYKACLTDLRSRFVVLLNNLQRQYEDVRFLVIIFSNYSHNVHTFHRQLTSEAKSLNRFLNKFENQFDNFDYNRLVTQAKDLELRKRMLQQRLTFTHQESQKKYDLVKSAMLKDPRLKLVFDDDSSSQ